MNKKMTKEEANQYCKEMIFKYLEVDNFYSYMDWVKTNGHVFFTTLEKWIEFARDNLSKEEAHQFVSKAAPLLPFDANEVKEKEELTAKVVEMAKKVSNKDATIYDIKDEVSPSLTQFITMVKEATFRLKLVSKSDFRRILDYYWDVKNYKKYNSITISYPDLKDDEVKKVKEFMDSYNVPANNITFKEAYKACRNRGIINKNNKNR